MSGFTKVLIVGASGYVGERITEAFLNATPKWTVHLLVRSDALKDAKKKPIFDKYVSLGANIIEGEASKPETYKDKLKEIEVIVSTLGTPVIHTQVTLIQAAKEAGVKLFLPSEFGFDFERTPEEKLFESKRAIRRATESAGLNHLYIATGPFYEFLFGWSNWGQDLANHTVAQIGDRSAKLTAAPFGEVAELLPAIVNDPSAINTTVVLSGGHVTTGELFDELVAALGGKDKVKTKTITVADVQKQVDEGQIIQVLLLLIATGAAYDPNAIDGSKYGKKLSTVKEFLPKFIQNGGPYF